MTPALLLFSLLLLLLAQPILWALPSRMKMWGHAAWSLLLAAVTLIYVLPAWQGAAVLAAQVAEVPLLGPVHVQADALSAFFVLVANLTCVMGAWYGIGYLRSSTASASKLALHGTAYNLLHLSMVLLPMLEDLPAFLFMWEVMSVASTVLVLHEGEKGDTLQTAINYFVQMHIGFLLLLAGYLLLASGSGVGKWSDLGAVLADAGKWPVAVVLMLGFGFKAGALGLHTWLPRAHPAAPSHVSAVMSGGMIKLGIYGILRVVLALQHDLGTFATALIVVGSVTALYGILQSTLQRDMKAALAYSSIENIGIILLGIGLGVLGRYLKSAELEVLGFTGALLHVLVHALFKPLLFFGAGALYTSTHTRDMDTMGGLLKRMPYTGACFLFGSLTACALPMSGAFISEFLLYRGVLDTLQVQNLEIDVLLVLSMIVLALVGGLALFSFTRMAGISLLGAARSEAAAQAQEVRAGMWVPQLVLLLPLALIGLLPTVAIQALAPLARLVATVTIPEGASGETLLALPLQVLAPIAQAGQLLAGGIVLVLVLRTVQQGRVTRRSANTWGCGYTAPTAKLQYTATSYGDSMARLTGGLVRRAVTYERPPITDIFPQTRAHHTEPQDPVAESTLQPATQGLLELLRRMARLQTGHVQDYIGYACAFLLLLLLLTFTGII